jgi:hypothetical protein
VASVKQAWIRKFGEEEGLRRWAESNLKRAISLQNYISKFGEIEGKLRWEKWLQNQKEKGTLKWFVERYGVEDGKIKYKEKNSHLSVGKETLRKAGRTEVEVETIRKNHALKSKTDILSMQKRHGVEKGTDLYKRSCERKRLNSKRTLDYWLSIYAGDKDSAKKALADYQRKDEACFIRLYGVEKGSELYVDYIARKTKNWKNTTYNHSKGQVEVESFVRSLVLDEKVYGFDSSYAIFLKKLEQEKLGQRVIYPDVVLKKRKVLVEYYGVYWHGHPERFPDSSIQHPYISHLTIQQIRNRDELKLQILKDRGWVCVVVWENEWQQNREQVEQRLKEVLL